MKSSPATSPFIAIACGGTGGHLFPGLAVAEQLRDHGCRVALLISPKEVDQQAVSNVTGIEVITLPAVALQSGRRLAFLRGFWKSWRAARELFRGRPPQAVLAMGGFTSAPPVLAARSAGAKTFLHESNTIPGRANRWLARLVDQAFVGFPTAAGRLRTRRVTVTGTPVRPQFRVQDAAADRAHFGFDPVRPVVVVTGGSQGASGLNNLVRAALPLVAERMPHWQWLHLTGTHEVEQMKQAYAGYGIPAVVRSFLPEMERALGAATAVVSRAGASSLAELAAVRVTALLVPFPAAADNHQFFNATALVETGAARLLEQKTATPAQFLEVLTGLVEDAEAAGRLRVALAQWDVPDAAEQIARQVLQSITKPSVKESNRPQAVAEAISNSRLTSSERVARLGSRRLVVLAGLAVGVGRFPGL